MAKKEKSFVCVKDGKWAIHTPKSGQAEVLKARLEELGYVVKKRVNKPSLSTLQKWSMDGVAKTLMGQRIEPDGQSADGCPSWLIYLGFI